MDVSVWLLSVRSSTLPQYLLTAQNLQILQFVQRAHQLKPYRPLRHTSVAICWCHTQLARVWLKWRKQLYAIDILTSLTWKKVFNDSYILATIQTYMLPIQDPLWWLISHIWAFHSYLFHRPMVWCQVKQRFLQSMLVSLTSSRGRPSIVLPLHVPIIKPCKV